MQFRLNTSICAALGLVTVSTVLLGCSGSESTGSTLTGVVTINGQPLDNGLINFNPKGTGGSTAVAPINADGSFEAKMSRSMKGIQPGTYTVLFESWKVEPGGELDGKVYPNGISAIPPKYKMPESMVTITIDPNTAHNENFDLAGDGESEGTVDSESLE